MKKGFLFLNAYETSPAHLYQPRRLREEFAARGGVLDTLANGRFAVGIDGGVRCALGDYGFGVYLDKDRYASVLFEACGLRLYNRAAAVAVCDDKMATHIALAAHGLAQPATLPAPLCYLPEAVIAPEETDAVVARLGLPVVVKTSYGSLGKGVFLAKTRDELAELMRGLKLTPHLYQRYVAESAGRDVRILCIGGKTVAAMRRTARDDFRSNAALGGVGEPCDPPAAYRALAEAAAAALGLDYCGVDLLESAGGPLICEVNSNAFFGALERTTGVNVAGLYADYILQSR